MRALVKTAAGPGLQMVEVPRPIPGDNDVLIRVLRTGICGTDVRIARWDPWAARTIRPPLILGHEFAGEVVRTGGHVGLVHVGDLVSGEVHLVCGRCRNCLAGRRNLCIRTLGLGVHVDGAFAEYVCIPQQNIWVHQHPIDIDVAAIFDPFGKAVHAALSFPVVGEDVLITGAGPIGIMAAEAAQHAGANHVVITDISEFRLELARKVGVTMAVDVRSTSIADVRRELGIDEGFTVGMEMSASPQAFTDLIANMTHGGCISVLGLPSEAQQINLADVVFRALSVRGIYGRQMFDTWHSMSVMSRSSLAISEVITDRVGFEDYALALDIARSACCGKVVIDWTRPN